MTSFQAIINLSNIMTHLKCCCASVVPSVCVLNCIETSTSLHRGVCVYNTYFIDDGRLRRPFTKAPTAKY
jgi:hypothetical protein